MATYDPLADIARSWKDQGVSLLAALLIALSGGSEPSDIPTRHMIAKIESGLQLYENIANVGVGDSASMNRASRVKVRAVTCRAESNKTAICSYEANNCRTHERDENGDGWCQRTTRFVRDRHAWQGEP